MRLSARRSVVVTAVLLVAAPTATAAKRRTDCEAARSRTVVETAVLRVYERTRGSSKSGTRSTSSYACRKGSKSKPIFLFDDADGPGGFENFVALGTRLAMTSFTCDNTGAGCSSGAALLDVRTRKRLSGPAQPEGSGEGTWRAVRALPGASGVLVYSARLPQGAAAEQPVADGRIVVVGSDQVAHELDRGPGVEADSLAVAHRAGKPSLFTWRTAGQLRAAEL